MRPWLFLISALLLVAMWYPASDGVAQGDAAAQSAAPLDPLADAQAQEESLRAVEWYTNEAVRKALQAEAAGDAENARLFGEKAIASDQKAKGIREQAAAAWLRVNESAKASELWTRAANMAEERARMLANRIPTLRQQWEQAPPAAPDRQEREVRYLQAILLAAQQWAVAADFHARAGDSDASAEAWQQNAALLPALAAGKRLQALAADSRLAGAEQQLQAWQQRARQSGRAP